VKLATLAQVVFVILAAVAVYFFVAAAKQAEVRHACTPLCTMRPNYANLDRLAPEFDLPNLEGKRVKLSDYRGKVVILNFWTKTCQPCLEEMPAFGDLAKALSNRNDVALVTISTDETAADARATLESVLGSKQPPFEVLMDPDARIVTDTYGTKLFPETWFIDADGVIRARFDGTRQWGDALTVDLVNSLRHPIKCQVEFTKGRAVGPFASFCGMSMTE
jgi:peroxiredoxin